MLIAVIVVKIASELDCKQTSFLTKSKIWSMNWSIKGDLENWMQCDFRPFQASRAYSRCQCVQAKAWCFQCWRLCHLHECKLIETMKSFQLKEQNYSFNLPGSAGVFSELSQAMKLLTNYGWEGVDDNSDCKNRDAISCRSLLNFTIIR